MQVNGAATARCVDAFLRAMALSAAIVAAALPCPARAADAVTEWTVEADRLGGGGANWRTLAIMHMAMHDVAQEVAPRYESWSGRRAAPAPGAPSLRAALAAAAAEVLVELHPAATAEIQALRRSALGSLPQGPATTAGVTLGEAAGRDAVRRRADDGYSNIRPFAADAVPGRWRPEPPRYEGSNTTSALPFLFPAREWPGERPPPKTGSAAFEQDVREVSTLGGHASARRTAAQTDAAEFWAYQSSQRGFVLLAVRLLDGDATLDLVDRARLMSLLTAAMADAAVLAWAEKERYSAWRPITVLRGGAPGIVPDPAWEPTIETPPHPEYPSGHAADCFTGAAIIGALFPVRGQVDYVALTALPSVELASIGMGQHAQPGGLHELSRSFATLDEAARECAESRIWAGAHFRSANEESGRLAAAILARAQAALPLLPGAR